MGCDRAIDCPNMFRHSVGEGEGEDKDEVEVKGKVVEEGGIEVVGC